MDSILALVSEKNKKWVSGLDLKDVAHILDSMALMPDIINTIPNAEFITEIDGKNPYSETPALKGLEGENEFESMCTDMLSSQFKLINTAKKAKSGDFSIQWTSPETGQIYTYLIDVKNYRSTIPYKEVEKFYRDIELYSSLNGAILISLHSKIVGHNSVFQYEEKIINTNSIPIAYVCSNEPNVIIEIIKFMCSLSEIKQNCGINLTRSEKVMRCIKDLEMSIDMFSQSRGNLQEVKMILEKQFNKIFMNLLSVEHIFKTKIQGITKALMEVASPRSESSNRKNNISQRPIEDIMPNGKATDETETEIKLDYPEDIVISLNNGCEKYTSSESLDSMIRHIWSNGDWDTGEIDTEKNEWTVRRSRDNTSILFKFTKKHTNIVIPNIKDNFLSIIEKKKIGKITRKGYHAKLNQSSYEILCLVCEIKI